MSSHPIETTDCYHYHFGELLLIIYHCHTVVPLSEQPSPPFLACRYRTLSPTISPPCISHLYFILLLSHCQVKKADVAPLSQPQPSHQTEFHDPFLDSPPSPSSTDIADIALNSKNQIPTYYRQESFMQ